MKINSLTIVGGGSAGWMTAALLSKYSDIKITLIESENIKTIGVGESTLQHFNRLVRRLDLTDREWMPKCKATYKTSIAFKNWRDGKGERFQYPFGNFDFDGLKNNPIQFFKLQSMYGKDLYPTEDFARFCNHNTFLSEESKLSRQIDETFGNFDFDNDTAYHIDADLFGEYLRDNICVQNGVNHIIGDVNDVVIDAEGNISHLTCNNKIIKSDLYIDCTGFKSLLLEKNLNVPFVSFKDELFNDKAISVRTPYINKECQMHSYTDCVAMSAGWIWNIPLWHRLGRGYCYSSKYIDKIEAEIEFKKYLKEIYPSEMVENFKFNHINIKQGKHQVAWKNNCVAIGLSFGFLEPLESTGLLTSHESAIMLCDVILRRNNFVSRMDVDSFNHLTDNMIERFKDFVVSHYTLSQRFDTKYWNDCINVGMSNRYIKHILNFNSENNLGIIYVAAGLGLNPINEAFLSETPSDSMLKMVHNEWQTNKKMIIKYLKDLPTHYQYLKNNIYI